MKNSSSHKSTLTNSDETENKEQSSKPIKKKFMDESEESDDDSNEIVNNITSAQPLMQKRSPMDYLFTINGSPYPFKPWIQYFPKQSQIKLRSLLINPAWNEFFDSVMNKKYFADIEDALSKQLKQEGTILPYAELVFNIFNVVSPKKIKVVFIGQDPYIKTFNHNNQTIPQAMGFSFSVPPNCPIPPSLHNIYKNLEKFDHINSYPKSGCLSAWVLQGCFMMNAAFTTIMNISNAHKDLWTDFSVDLIKYINANCDNIVFVAWGTFAHKLCLNIDPKRHYIITSTHPSPHSCNNKFDGVEYGNINAEITYPSFNSVDHFGKINKYLGFVNKEEILWDLVE